MTQVQEHSTTKSWELYRKNQKVLATGTGTLSKRPRFEPEEPCYIARAKGCRVWDIDGNEYVDFRNALGPVTLGYCFPAVDEAIREQLGNGIIFCHPSPLEGEVAELLVELIPCAEKVRYLKTGGEAMAASIKLARAVTGRDMVLQCGYNGWLNSLAVGGLALPRQKQAAPIGVPLALAKLHRGMPWDDMGPWERAFNMLGDEIACAVVAMEYTTPERGPDFLAALRKLTEKHGALLIVDEIVSGFRVARGGLHEYCNVDVDLAVFSKGIANGMPVSALVGKREFMDYLERAIVSSTFSGESLSLAAARACLSTHKKYDVIAHLDAMGRLWMDGINGIFKERGLPLVAKGMACCSAFAGLPGAEQEEIDAAMERLYRAAYANGVSLFATCYTNFSFTEADVAEALERVAKGLSR